MAHSRNVRIAATALLLVVAAVYIRVVANPFVLLDDNLYLTENPVVQRGLTADGVRWAFTTFHAANWHPVTWLSHMLDVTLFGMNPGMHHLVGVAFHVANTLLLFLVISRWTGAPWRSLFVAALFGLHPLHVESVAWASERKDVLSTFFFLLSLLAWRRYCERPSARQYLPVLLLFGVGLMAKPMLVTFPILLLLLDYWPLRRTGSAFPVPEGDPPASYPAVPLSRLLLEKVPLLAFAIASCVITSIAQREGGAMPTFELMSFGNRLEVVLPAYAAYIGKMFWPSGLAVFYPLIGSEFAFPATAGGALLIAGLSYLAFRKAARLPHLFLGWFWFLGTLVPVIGLVQVGMQSMADRYTYLPLIGLFIVLAWEVPRFVPESSWRGKTLAAGAVAVLSVLSMATYVQAGYWNASRTLFEHSLAATGKNMNILNNYGLVLQKEGDLESAERQFREALGLNSNLGGVWVNLGTTLRLERKTDEAISVLAEGLRRHPGDTRLLGNIGGALADRRDFAAAIPYLQQATGPDQAIAEPFNNLGVSLASLGRTAEAVPCFRQAVRLEPGKAGNHVNLGVALAALGMKNEAAASFREALRLDPGNGTARQQLGAL